VSFRRDVRVNPEEEQNERMERWLLRLQAQEAIGVDESTIVDYVLVVLQQCDAMRDWLREAPKIKAARDPARSYKRLELSAVPDDDLQDLFNCEELKVCKAIVDGSKHLTLSAPHVDNNVISDVPYPEGRARPLRVSFTAAGKEYDAIDLCVQCVERIRGFLLAHGWPKLLNRCVPDLGRLAVAVRNPEGTPWP
jgi:hypothetical protein